MLSILALWAVLGLVFFVVGAPLVQSCGLGTTLARGEDRVFVALWLGMVVFAGLLLLVSLFSPVNLYVALFVLIVQALPSTKARCGELLAEMSMHKATIAVLVLFMLLLAASTAVSVNVFEDSGVYHLQMTKWFSEYGAVHGLALLDGRYGFTSAWFALAAPLRTGVLMDQLLLGLDSFVFLVVSGFAIVVAGRVLAQRAKLADWFYLLAYILVCRSLYYTMVYSLSPDLPVIFLTVTLAWLILGIETDSTETVNTWRWPGMAVLLLGAGAVIIKLSALPLLAVAGLYYLLGRKPTWAKLGFAMILPTGFLAIFMAVSITTSGCPLFPSPVMCTDSPWSVGADVARGWSAVILEFARWVGAPPADATAINWLWHASPNHNYFNDKPLMLLLLIANVIGLGWLALRHYHQLRGSRYVMLLATVGIGFILVAAPHLRFALGLFALVPALTLAHVFHARMIPSLTELLQRWRVALSAFVVYVLLVPYIDSYQKYYLYGISIPSAISHLVRMPEAWLYWPRAQLYMGIVPQLVSLNNFKYYHPNEQANKFPPLCFTAPLPCAMNEVDGNVWLRDETKGLAGGFENRRIR